MLVVGKIEIDKDVGSTLGRFEVLIGKVESVVKQLEEVEQFYQPGMLSEVCGVGATQQDRKRRYEAGLMSITCIRDKGPTVVRVPSRLQSTGHGPDRRISSGGVDCPSR